VQLRIKQSSLSIDYLYEAIFFDCGCLLSEPTL
jgi:hypothetical protein